MADHGEPDQARLVVDHAVVEEVAERALVADQHADADEGDAGDGRHPQPGDDRGRRDRQLDLEVPAYGAEAHGGRRVERLLRHRPDTVDDRRDEHHEAVDAQRDHHGQLALAGVVDEDDEERQRGDRVQDRRHPQHGRVQPAQPHAQLGDGQRRPAARTTTGTRASRRCSADQTRVRVLEVAGDVEEAAVHPAALSCRAARRGVRAADRLADGLLRDDADDPAVGVHARRPTRWARARRSRERRAASPRRPRTAARRAAVARGRRRPAVSAAARSSRAACRPRR